jgi:hypothetical protein
MLEKIKNCLKSKKLLATLLFVFIFAGLFIPITKARADLFGITETIQMIYDAVEEQVQPFIKALIQAFFGYIIGLISLYLSAYLLQFAINGQVDWLKINNSALVQSGWHFVAGLTNLFLILVFVIIVIAYILKIETFQAKKALPKLIIVALLMNFSLVFIGMLVDISNILYNTILSGNENLIIQYIDTFGAGALENLILIGIWLGSLIVLWAIPFVGAFAQLAFVILMLAVSGPNVMIWILQFVLFAVASGLFFTYTFLFAARVFVIQILAIISPLAFLCMVLPQTQKYWKEWVQHLLEWLMMGIVVLFFLSLGVRASSTLVPPGGYTPTPILGWGMLQPYFVYYFFVFIYLIIVLFISHKFMPTLAAFIISQATAMGNMAYARVIRPVTTPLAKGLREGGREAAERIRGRIAESPRIQAWGEKQAIATGRWAGAVKRGIGKQIITAGTEASKQRMAKTETQAEKIKDITLMASEFKSAISMKDLPSALAYFNQAVKKGGGFAKQFLKSVTDEEAVLIGKYANKIKAVPEAERVARVYKHDRDMLSRMGVEIDDEDRDKYKTAEERRTGAVVADDAIRQRKVIAEARKVDEIKELSLKEKVWETPDAREIIQKFWGGPQVGKAAEEFGREFVDAYMRQAETRDRAWYAENNPSAFLYLSGNAAQDFGFRSLGGLGRKEVRDRITCYREWVAQGRPGTLEDFWQQWEA